MLNKVKNEVEERLAAGEAYVEETHRRLSTTIKLHHQMRQWELMLARIHQKNFMVLMDSKPQREMMYWMENLKRVNSSPGVIHKIGKRQNQHPSVDEFILVETVEGQQVFKVGSKKEKKSNDFTYNLI